MNLNRMTKGVWAQIAFVLCLVAAWGAVAAEGYAVQVLAERPDAVYKVTEEVTFTIAVTQGDKPVSTGEVRYVLSNDGEGNLGEGTLALTGEILRVKGSLPHPGFLRCTATYTGPDGKAYANLAGAGVDPLAIKASLPVPDDFDAFWAEKKAELAKVPINAKLTPVESGDANVDCFDVQLDSLGGAPVSGYLAIPKDAKAKALPALLTVHGAGVRSSNKPVGHAAKGLIALDINAHGIPNGKPKEYYTDLAKGRLAGYRTEGRESRETCYFLGMYFRLMRAMEYLMARPEWDGEELIVMGSSQGGGQSLVAAGLEPKVTALIANVPAMCDHTGIVNGWPRLVPRDEGGNPDPKIQQVARYFDAMNFAARTQAEALVTVGFIDNTCRPTSVYAAYNNLPGEKRIINEPRMPHATWASYTEAAEAMLQKHINR